MDNLVLGMRLLEPGFRPETTVDGPIGRLRGQPATDEAVDRAVDLALAATGWDVVDVDLPGWGLATAAGRTISTYEAAANWAYLLSEHRDGVADDVAERLGAGATVHADQHRGALVVLQRWQAELAELFSRVAILALPTLGVLAPSFGHANLHQLLTWYTRPFNIGGGPALSLPIPVAGSRVPASLQLVGPQGSDELLCAAGKVATDATN